MVDGEKWVVTLCFELPLTYDTTSCPFKWCVSGIWKKTFHIWPIVRVLIRAHEGIWVNKLLHAGKELCSGFPSQISSVSILFSSFCGKQTLRRHLSHLKAKNTSGRMIDHLYDRDGLHLGRLKCLKIIELNFHRHRLCFVMLIQSQFCLGA